MKKSKSQRLDICEVMKEFRKTENSLAHRKGTFKIEGTFEDALKKILKAKPEPKTQKPSAKQRNDVATISV